MCCGLARCPIPDREKYSLRTGKPSCAHFKPAPHRLNLCQFESCDKISLRLPETPSGRFAKTVRTEGSIETQLQHHLLLRLA